MRATQTLFVIGAGASKEVGLPTGKELVEKIAAKLDYRSSYGTRLEGFGDDDILDALQQYAHQKRESIDSYVRAATRLRDGVIYANSIDSFLDVHSSDEQVRVCGKLAIAKTILEAERSSLLFIENRSRDFSGLDALKQTWFLDFARNINDGIRAPEIERIFEKVSFIIFNYDRCFEHFMFNALQRHYSIDVATAASTMKTLKVYHPYGTIGGLPWQDRDGIPFGCEPQYANMLEMPNRIKTYTERVEDDQTLTDLRATVSEAATLVFLGFSYHPENMKLLNPGSPRKASRAYGTAYDTSESDIVAIREQVTELLDEKKIPRAASRTGEAVRIYNSKCATLLRDNSRGLFLK